MFVFPSWTGPPAPRKFCFCEVLCGKGKCERIQHLQSQKPEPGPIWDSDVPPHYLIFQSERKQKQGQDPWLISSQKTRRKGKRHNYPEGRFFQILHWEKGYWSEHLLTCFLKKVSKLSKKTREKRILKHKKNHHKQKIKN